jgi:hypothetical protein
VPKKRPRQIRFAAQHELETRPAKIVSDPGKAYMRPDGKLSPLVEIDVSARPDIDALFAAYSPDTVGDVALQWGQREGAPKGSITLFSCLRPRSGCS